MDILLLLPLFILTILWLVKKSKTQHKTLNLPPGPWQLPVIGNLHQLAGSSPHQSLHALAKKHGPIMRLKLGEVDHVIVSTPEIAEQVMKTHDIIFANRPSLLVPNVVTYNNGGILFVPYGDYLRQVKKICTQELLSSSRVQSFRPLREEAMSSLVRHISSNTGSPMNLSELICSSTYGITAKAACGEKCNDQIAEFLPLADKVINAGTHVFGLVDFFPSVKFLFKTTGMLSSLEKLHKDLDRVLQSIVDGHKEARVGDAQRDHVSDLVDVLLDLQESGDLDFPLKSENIKGIVLDIFIAGSEASSTTIEWTMSELLRHPEVMKKAQEEVRGVFDKKGFVDEASLRELSYLKLVIKETLRLHPPVPLLLPRECTENCKISGYQIPKSSVLIVNAWAMARDPNHWNEPEKFSPERFLENNIDYEGSNVKYIPFGAGRRMCLGVTFGSTNVELALANLLYHFDWKLADGITPETLDMEESFGATVRRKNFLNLIPTSHNHKRVIDN